MLTVTAAAQQEELLPVARRLVREWVESDAFDVFLASGDELTQVPVMVLDRQLQDAIGAQAQVVVMSGQTYAKQRRNHPELTRSDYSVLALMAEDPDIVFQSADLKIALIWYRGVPYRAVVKAADDGRQLFLVSFHRIRQSQVSELRAKLSVVYERP